MEHQLRKLLFQSAALLKILDALVDQIEKQKVKKP